MTGRTSFRLTTLLIVSAVAACDNVEWGGSSLHLQPPPAREGVELPEEATELAEEVRGVPDGPVLYLAERDAGGLRLTPAGEIAGDSLDSFPSDDDVPGYSARFAAALMSEGAEFVLFAEGVRVGSFTARSVETDASFCVARPVARGVAELLPEAMGVTRFLALPRDFAGERARHPFVVAELDRPQRDATLALPQTVLSTLGATLPPNILDIRFDTHAFEPIDGPSLFTATYLFRDRLMIERPPPSAYSLFLLGVPVGGGHEAGYVWYRDVAEQGKGAPRFFEQLDWSGDGRTAVVLEVLGERHRWLAVLAQRDGRWTRVFEDPCGAAAPPVGGGVAGSAP